MSLMTRLRCKHRNLWTGATDFCECGRTHYFCDDCGIRTDPCWAAPRSVLQRGREDAQYGWWWVLNRVDDLRHAIEKRIRRDR